MKHAVAIPRCLLVLALAAVLGGAAGFAVLASISSGIVPQPAWDSGTGSPVPDDFLIVMFPVDADVGVYSDADSASARIGTLDRALANSFHELDDEWIYVNGPDADSGGYVRRDRLIFDLPAERRDPLVKTLLASERDRGLDPMVTLFEPIGTAGGFRARMGWSGGSWDEYRWTAAGEAARPDGVLQWHEQWVVGEGMGAMLIGALVGGIVFVFSALVGTVAVLVLAYRQRAA